MLVPEKRNCNQEFSARSKNSMNLLQQELRLKGMLKHLCGYHRVKSLLFEGDGPSIEIAVNRFIIMRMPTLIDIDSNVLSAREELPIGL